MLSIIIPTLNEKDTILTTIKEIKKNIKGITHEILVIDDNSPDKTWEVVNKAKIQNTKSIRRLRGKSLSSAVMLGFERAKYKNLLVMDADGQHDPKIIKEMLKEIPKNDFVTGSRFIKGGSVEGWPKKRILMSKTAAMLAKPILNTKVKDPMSGFFMTNKKIFKEVKPRLSGKGYKIFLEMIFEYEQKRKKAKIAEVPYTFRTRKKGESKLGFNVLKAYGLMLLKFAIKKYKKIIKFLIVGLLGVIVNTGILWILTELAGVHYLISGIIATQTAIIHNFLLNNSWTWNGKNKKHSYLKRLISFNTVSLIGLGITVSTLWFLTDIIGIYYIISNLIGIALATTWNFIANDKITFKQK